MIAMTNGILPLVKAAVIGLVVLASADMGALAGEPRGLVTSVNITDKVIVVTRFETRTEEKIKLGAEAVITMAGAKIGLGDPKADDHRSVTVSREAGVATSVVVDPMPGAPVKDGTIEMDFRHKTESGFEVYLDKFEYFVPVYKGLVVETPCKLVPGRDLAISHKDMVPVKIVTKEDIDGK